MTGVARPFAQLPGERWLGANFWSRGGGPFMWRSYDGELVSGELAVLAEHGLNLTRSFLFWPHAMPAPFTLDDQVLDRYADFLDRHTAAGLATIPTFLVGHMSGENWDPSWRGGRDLYSDTWLVAQQAWYIRHVVKRFADHPAIVGWLISNEMPIYAGSGEREQVRAWAELMVQAVRAGGSEKPVSLGDGAWGLETTGTDNGYSLRDLAPLTDFVGPHVYRMETDVVRSHLKSAFVCELASVTGQPVILEEFGVTSDFASDQHAADYYRQTLHLSLLGGAVGWIAWNNTDFDNLAGQDPYRHHPFELHFGLTTVEGTPKPQLLELRDFAKVLEAVDISRCARWPATATVVVPAHLDGPPAFTFSDGERRATVRSLEQSYVAAREADLQVRFAREPYDDPEGTPLVLVPSVKALTAPTWLRLREVAAAGAIVYASYSTGDCPDQRGPWWTGLDETFGVRHTLRYGLVEPVGEEVVLEFRCDFGSFAAGDTLTIRTSGGPDGRVRLPVEPSTAEVIAVDQHGAPILTRHRLGDGQAVLSTIPLEWFAAGLPGINPDPTWRIYDALALEAGIERPHHVPDPRILVDGLDRDDGSRFVWLCNASSESIEVPLGSGMTELGTSSPTAHVRLTPFGVHVIQRKKPPTNE